MEDEQIIGLYFARNEQAIVETDEKYGHYCHRIATNITNDHEDAKECVNDTYLHAWNTIPPHTPSRLATFLGKITRNLSLDRYQKRNAKKRGGCEIDVVLEELEECLSAGDSVEQELDLQFLGQKISEFLATCKDEERNIFLLRYWEVEPVSKIAIELGVTESKVKTTLHRTRKNLKTCLEKEGIWI